VIKSNSTVRQRTILAGASLLSLAFVIGCEEKGPMQKAGERADNAAKALDPRGPAEKAGAKIDDAINK